MSAVQAPARAMKGASAKYTACGNHRAVGCSYSSGSSTTLAPFENVGHHKGTSKRAI
ncbi:protein of unknown function (plasmid) [Azospirillum baldaniorum]|uniref:Uncharacterized protein n=1 Tax=Azospirillum baldaniorum TaxID=1064539 RepID=A0A9P1K1F2_9PROT|nr:protein of unknown function [Azospirillum baldaniorum]